MRFSTDSIDFLPSKTDEIGGARSTLSRQVALLEP